MIESTNFSFGGLFMEFCQVLIDIYVGITKSSLTGQCTVLGEKDFVQYKYKSVMKNRRV